MKLGGEGEVETSKGPVDLSSAVKLKMCRPERCW